MIKEIWFCGEQVCGTPWTLLEFIGFLILVFACGFFMGYLLDKKEKLRK